MDFHILTKKQAECLTQIATRESVSSFFEPLRVVRELESLRLITMEPSDQFDSGFAYSLSGLSKALTPFCAGTKYSLVPLANDHTAIFVHYNPATDGDFDPEEAAKDKARLERSNKNLAEAVQRLESDLQVVKAQNQSLENIRASLQRQRDEALNERDQTNEALEIVRRDRNGILATLREKTEVIAQLQRTVDDYAQQQKVDRAVIKILEQPENLFKPKGFADFTINPVNSIGTAYGVGDGCKGVEYVVFHHKGRPQHLFVRTAASFAATYEPVKK